MSAPMTDRIKILFLCTGNSCRSQMAEGWTKYLGGEKVIAYSAGMEKRGLDPRAVKVMAEAGVDISKNHSKTVEELPVQLFDLVVTLCGHADETCPFFSGAKRLHRGFEDPPKLAAHAKNEEEALAPYRRVRDEIGQLVKELCSGLENAGAPLQAPRS